MWKEGILGVVVGDAVGCPVQFESRSVVASHPVTDMRGNGTFNLPAGSWTDDSSLTLALLDSFIESSGIIAFKDIANKFVRWLEAGEYTPFGYAYDIGNGCYSGIKNYMRTGNPLSGESDEMNNGNGSLMRILPACILYSDCADKGEIDYAITAVECVSSITHAHKRARIACGLYYFIVRSIINRKGDLNKVIQEGLDEGFAYYEDEHELEYFKRISYLDSFKHLPTDRIKSSGYVVDSLEAAIWCLANTSSYKEAILKAASLGLDTDTICAIAGGLAGLYYGIGGEKGIPQEWIDGLQRKDFVIGLCEAADRELG